MQTQYKILYGRTPGALQEAVNALLGKRCGWAVVGQPWVMHEDGQFYYYQSMVKEEEEARL